ncbi:MAG TPA: PPOX class F420-dependent oxidoreductase, partial [Methylomirabilota bacterium]|nr:PPOX class F420-dependent oxidoreductase [Methylomirabilota bacterium]
RVAPCDARGGVTGTWQDATARLITDPMLITRAQAALRTKYGWQVRLLNLVSRLTGRAKRRAWIEISI